LLDEEPQPTLEINKPFVVEPPTHSRKSKHVRLKITARHAPVKEYEKWMAEVSKLGEMYKSAATDAYKPVEKAMEKQTS
jgi:hypothetical protein